MTKSNPPSTRSVDQRRERYERKVGTNISKSLFAYFDTLAEPPTRPPFKLPFKLPDPLPERIAIPLPRNPIETETSTFYLRELGEHPLVPGSNAVFNCPGGGETLVMPFSGGHCFSYPTGQDGPTTVRFDIHTWFCWDALLPLLCCLPKMRNTIVDCTLDALAKKFAVELNSIPIWEISASPDQRIRDVYAITTDAFFFDDEDIGLYLSRIQMLKQLTEEQFKEIFDRFIWQ